MGFQLPHQDQVLVQALLVFSVGTVRWYQPHPTDLGDTCMQTPTDLGDTSMQTPTDLGDACMQTPTDVGGVLGLFKTYMYSKTILCYINLQCSLQILLELTQH